jgi:hypothetical protein
VTWFPILFALSLLLPALWLGLREADKPRSCECELCRWYVNEPPLLPCCWKRLAFLYGGGVLALWYLYRKYVKAVTKEGEK